MLNTTHVFGIFGCFYTLFMQCHTRSDCYIFGMLYLLLKLLLKGQCVGTEAVQFCVISLAVKS